MDGSLPPQAGKAADQPLPVGVGKDRRSPAVKGGVIGKHHPRRFWGGSRPSAVKSPLDIPGQSRRRRPATAVLLGGLGKGKISGLGKVLRPGEGIDPGSPSWASSTVRSELPVSATMISSTSPWTEARHRGRVSLLIFYNHAKADGNHKQFPPNVQGLPQRGGSPQARLPLSALQKRGWRDASGLFQGVMAENGKQGKKRGFFKGSGGNVAQPHHRQGGLVKGEPGFHRHRRQGGGGWWSLEGHRKGQSGGLCGGGEGVGGGGSRQGGRRSEPRFTVRVAGMDSPDWVDTVLWKEA